MKRSVIETLLGAVVLLVAGMFLFYGLKAGSARREGGTNIFATFSTVGGLNAGDDVVISGVRVGHIESITLEPTTYLARVDMSIDPGVRLSTDTSAVIGSQSLLGGNNMQLQPGSDETFLKAGDRIKYTQAPVSLTDLLGKFIFNANAKPAAQAGAPDGGQAAAPTSAPAVVPPPAPADAGAHP